MKNSNELLESIKDIIEIKGQFIDGFISIDIKKEIHDENGNVIPTGLHFFDNKNNIYRMNITGQEKNEFKGQLEAYKTSSGKKFNFNYLVELILNDSTLSPFIKNIDKKVFDKVAKESMNTMLKNLPRCTSVKTDSLYIPVTKLSRNINRVVEAGLNGVIIDVGSKNSDKKIYTNCIISFDSANTNLSKKINRYDTLVYNAIATYADYCGTDKLITLDNIYRIMVGDSGNATPSKEHIKRIKQSIDKMRVYIVKIDCTNEVKAYNKKHLAYQYNGLQVSDDGKFYYDTYLLACEWVSAVTNRNEVHALHLLKEPVMLSYAKISGQILNIPSYLLDTKHIQPNTERNLIIKDCLIQRIAGMKNQNSLTQKTISLNSYSKMGLQKQGLYEQVTQQSEISKKDASTIREVAVKYLEYWKEIGYIKDYLLEKKGKSFSSIKIDI